MFPEKIWDGRSETRSDLSSIRPPDYSDWLQLISEVRAMQQYTLSLGNNVIQMPDLPGLIAQLRNQLSALESKIAQLHPPEDVVAEVNKFRDDLCDFDMRDPHAKLRQNVRKLYTRAKRLDSAYRNLKKTTDYERETFNNMIRNTLAKMEASFMRKIEDLEVKIAELTELLENPELD